MMLPVRKPAKGMALVVAYQYIKRVVSHFSSSQTSIAVAAYVKKIHALKGIGTWSSPSASSTRRVLQLSADECTELLRGDSFIRDAHGRLAILDALAKVIDEIDGTASMVSWSGPNKASRVIRCLYGHLASVVFRVSLHLLLCVLSRLRWCPCRLACPVYLDFVARRPRDGRVLYQPQTFSPSRAASWTAACCCFWLVLAVKVRSFLRNRAGLPSVVMGAGILNQGHRSLFERALVLLHNIMPKDSDIQDGLQLIDGVDTRRHLGCPSPSSETMAIAPAAPAGTMPTAPAPPATAPPLPLPEFPTGPVLPTPPHAVSLAPLPVGVPIVPGSQAAREADRMAHGDCDEEEDDEIRPIADELAAQLSAYRAARR